MFLEGKTKEEIDNAFDNVMALLFIIELSATLIIYVLLRSFVSTLVADFFLVVLYAIELNSNMSLLAPVLKKQLVDNAQIDGEKNNEIKEAKVEDASSTK